jgi:hypothetical protein
MTDMERLKQAVVNWEFHMLGANVSSETKELFLAAKAIVTDGIDDDS